VVGETVRIIGVSDEAFDKWLDGENFVTGVSHSKTKNYDYVCRFGLIDGVEGIVKTVDSDTEDARRYNVDGANGEFIGWCGSVNVHKSTCIHHQNQLKLEVEV
ncbi:MAG: hypothetical protein KUG64_10430, partial [Cycloclasticus sp.]|nr:hypothetical protein [Cycloclasticus sp.]